MIDNPFGIQLATEAELPPMAPLVRELISETVFQSVRDGYVEEVMDRCFQDGMIGVIREGGTAAGTVGMAVERLPHTTESHLRVHWLGTHPDFRRGGLAVRLLRFVDWCAENISHEGDGGLPILLSALTIRSALPKMALIQNRAPAVEVIFSFGCSPDYPLLTEHLGDAGKWRSGPSGGPRQGGRARQSLSYQGNRRTA